MKSLIIACVLLISVNSLKAQAPPPVPPLTPSWELIADRYYKENAKGISVPIFPAALQAQVNKIIELPGYMIPIKASMTYNLFFISVLPIYQCNFCDKGGIPNMVEVHLNKAIPYTEDPIKVKGKLVLNTLGNDSISEVVLANAEVVN